MSTPATRVLPALILGASLLTACGAEAPATLVVEARAKIVEGDYTTAMIQLKNAVAADNNNAEARFELGKLYFDQLDLVSAEKEFRRARDAGYDESAVNAMVARALLGQREFQRVLDELPAAAGDNVDTATLQALRATAELGLGRKEKARTTLQRAVQTAPRNADVHLALAQLALTDRDIDKAQLELGQALQDNPDHIDSLLLKGDLLRASGKVADASAAFNEVLKIAPRHINARLALAGIALSENRLDAARKEADAVLKTTPGNLQARHTLALIDFSEKKTEHAREQLTAVLKAAPNYVPALLLGGSIEYSLGNLQTAETHLNKVIAVAPNSPYALRMLAATQLRLGRPDDAARTLAPALKSASQDASLLLVAGEIALARKDFAQASAYFEQAAKQDPGNAQIRTELGIARLAQGDNRAMADLLAAAGMEGANARADTVIILRQLEQKQFDAALASIAALEKKQGASPITWNYRGAAHLGKKEAAKAKDSFAQALKLDPTFFPAAANLAQLDLKDKRPAAARQRFADILKADPRHLNAMLALADLGQLNQDEQTYVSWLEKAASAHPEALQPRIALARHQFAKGSRDKALATAREALNAQPDNPAALELLGGIQLALGDTANALGSYRKQAEHQPNQARPLLNVAAAQLAAKDIAGARKTLQDALRIRPDSLEAQLLLGGVEIQGARFDEAHKIAKHLQQQKSDDPAGYRLEGDVAFARKDYAAALTAFERAHKLQPSSALVIRQFKAMSADQQAEEGEKRLAAWLATHSQDVGIRGMLAESLIKRNQFKVAAEHYLILNKSNPDNLLVLNNLAWTLHQFGDPRAVSFAAQALKLQPENPMVMDTYGWILVQQGQSERGLKLLLQALSRAPDVAEIHWHLAAAYEKTGDRDRARNELDRLLKSGLAFPQEQEARELLKQLQSKSK